MKLQVEQAKNNQGHNNTVVLISGFGWFFGFLKFWIRLMNFSSKNSDHKQDDGDKSSVVLAIAFKLIPAICGFIYLRETQNNSNN